MSKLHLVKERNSSWYQIMEPPTPGDIISCAVRLGLIRLGNTKRHGEYLEFNIPAICPNTVTDRIQRNKVKVVEGMRIKSRVIEIK